MIYRILNFRICHCPTSIVLTFVFILLNYVSCFGQLERNFYVDFEGYFALSKGTDEIVDEKFIFNNNFVSRINILLSKNIQLGAGIGILSIGEKQIGNLNFAEPTKDKIEFIHKSYYVHIPIRMMFSFKNVFINSEIGTGINFLNRAIVRSRIGGERNIDKKQEQLVFGTQSKFVFPISVGVGKNFTIFKKN